jgi:hypothetical protein
MKMAAKIGVGGVVAAAAGVWFYFTPHLAVQNMKEAADERDANKLSRYIDFPAVRESMKATLNAKLMSEMAKNKKSDSPFAGLGAAFAMAMVGPMVDAMVTPEALTMMMKGERPALQKSELPSQQPKPQPVAQGGEGPKAETSLFYEGFDQFVVTIKKVASPDEPISLVMQRQGMFAWKVVSIRLPL